MTEAARRPHAPCAPPLTNCARRSSAAAPRLLKSPCGFGSSRGLGSPPVRLAGSAGWRRCLRPGVPLRAGLRRLGRPLRTSPRELTARGALPWAARPGEARQRPASPLRPSSRSAGLPAATRGTYLAGRTQWPPAPLALGSTRGGSTASPSARGGGCVCGGGEGRGWCLAGCGTNLPPFPPPPAAAPRPRWP